MFWKRKLFCGKINSADLQSSYDVLPLKVSVSITCIMPNLIFISKSKQRKFMCPIKFLWVSKCFSRAFFEPVLHHHCYYTSHYLQRWTVQHLSHGANMEDVLFFSVLPTLCLLKEWSQKVHLGWQSWHPNNSKNSTDAGLPTLSSPSVKITRKQNRNYHFIRPIKHN